MTYDFLSRMIGMVVFAVLGAQLGASIASFLNLTVEDRAFIFGLVGVLFGLIITPWITVRPIRTFRRTIGEMPINKLFIVTLGLLAGLVIALLGAYPLSLLPSPLGMLIPAGFLLLMVSMGVWLFSVRYGEIVDFLAGGIRLPVSRPSAGTPIRKLLLDTSVLIDGRIVEVADTGFLGGVLIIPRFVLSELHRVADSSDPLRRNRGRRGLNIVNKLQRGDMVPVRIVDDDFEDIAEVDDKLLALSIQMGADVVTNDYNLNRVAEAQGVSVLNINLLANAVRSIYIPGESFQIRIIQEGRDADQGVGYLDDGTMVVVENGKDYMERSIHVTVTKLINRETGRMIFAVPDISTDEAVTTT